MTYTEILNQIDKKILYPIYFLHGEEPYFIDVVSDYIEEHALDVSERDFNQTVVYGKDVKPDELFALAKGFPMMANYQVIIVREAQDIRPQDEFIKQLTEYLEKPVRSTILVFCNKYKKLDSRKKAAKLIQTLGVLFESPKIWDNQIPAWAKTFVKENGYRIGDKATLMMAEYVGSNLSRLANEFKKLFILTEKGAEITPDIIEKNIGISKDYNIFELYKSLGSKNHKTTFNIINYFGQNLKENPPAKVIPILFSFFNKIMLFHGVEHKSNENIIKYTGITIGQVNDYSNAAKLFSVEKAEKVISILREYDLKSKGIGSSQITGDQLLKEMIIKIAYVQ
jgi:DNA polymerase-3 subunit delta